MPVNLNSCHVTTHTYVGTINTLHFRLVSKFRKKKSSGMLELSQPHVCLCFFLYLIQIPSSTLFRLKYDYFYLNLQLHHSTVIDRRDYRDDH